MRLQLINNVRKANKSTMLKHIVAVQGNGFAFAPVLLITLLIMTTFRGQLYLVYININFRGGKLLAEPESCEFRSHLKSI